MEQTSIDQRIARRSALIYLPLSTGAALAFLLAANLIGNYTLVAKISGTVWVAILSLIVSMPIVTSQVKRKVRK
jgi:hypothetical protein